MPRLPGRAAMVPPRPKKWIRGFLILLQAPQSRLLSNAIVTHQNVLENAATTVDHSATGVSWLPHYHDMGLIGYYLFVIACGGTSYGLLPHDFLKRPALWLQTLSRVRATYASAPNFGFEYCLRPGKIKTSDLVGVDLSSLEVLMNAAEPVRVKTIRRFIERFAPYGLKPEAHVVAYGLAEGTLAVTHHGRRSILADRQKLRHGVVSIAPPDSEDTARVPLASCGRPLPGIELRIVDPQTLTALPERCVGEVWIASASVCHGYWGRPELTKNVFGNAITGDLEDTRRYLRTGDLGFLDAGELFVCGWIKELIIHRGVNYYPQDIEAAVQSASSKIRDNGIAAFNGDEREEALIIVAELKNPRDVPEPAEIAHAVRTQCQIDPQIIMLAPPRTITRTSSGKIARMVTRESFLAGGLPAVVTYSAPLLPVDTGATHSARDRLRSVLESCRGPGGESITLAEAGLDSVALMDVLLDLEQILADWGMPDLADDIDLSLLQQLKTTDLALLLERPARSTLAASEALHNQLQKIRSAFERSVQSRMRDDATLASDDLGTIELCDEPIEQVLMTGATGFFGPFLLSRLLAVTPYHYWVLVRANDPERGRARLHEALQRVHLWTPSLAKALENRLRIVCGDLSQERLGLPPDLWTSLTRGVQAVIHNAALVNYVLPYDAIKPHNVEGTRTLLRFAHSARRKEFHFISSTFIFAQSGNELSDPALADIVSYIMAGMRRRGLIGGISD
jgi:acyl-coenzyme A synthetase/AMP-(fatty) acid ligase